MVLLVPIELQPVIEARAFTVPSTLVASDGPIIVRVEGRPIAPLLVNVAVELIRWVYNNVKTLSVAAVYPARKYNCLYGIEVNEGIGDDSFPRGNEAAMVLAGLV